VRSSTGVARQNVLGLQAVLPTGEIIRNGGKIAKVSTGYDLTQMIIGSEGTLALVTEVIVKLHPRLDHSAAVLAPFVDFDQVMTAVPKVLATGPNALHPRVHRQHDDGRTHPHPEFGAGHSRQDSA